tara:strand:- start:2150 stop:3838 length:1689 start_codon:yes stop_codon:yes gene_type:complete
MLDLIGLSLIAPIILLLTENPDRLIDTINSLIFSKFGYILSFYEALLFFTLSIILVFSIKAFFSIVINKKILQFSWNQRTKLRAYLMDCYQNLPYKELYKRNTSEFIQIMEGPVGDFCTGVLTNLLRVACELIICIVIFSYLGIKNLNALLILIILYGSLFLVYNQIFIKKVIKLGENAVRGSVKLFQAVSEGVNGLKEIRILGKESFFHETLVESSKYQAENVVKSQIITLSPKYFIELLLITFIMIMSTIIILTGQGLNALVSNIAIFGFATVRLTPSINIITTGVTGIKYGTYATNKIYSEIKKYDDFNKKKVIHHKLKEIDLFEKLTVKNASFSYDSSQKLILKNISFSIKKGEFIGIIGASGSGKTTFVDLLLGLLDLDSGEFLLNNQPLMDKIDSWQSQIAYLPQEIFLIDSTLSANISLETNKEEVDNKKLLKSLKSAKLEKFVDDLPDGINTEIGQNGIMVSGGQRQRIALARAFYHERDLLVLDEATSALDHQIEKEIIEEINSLNKKTTKIMIAHRLSTLKYCNKIYEIKDKKILLLGSYEDLTNNTNLKDS